MSSWADYRRDAIVRIYGILVGVACAQFASIFFPLLKPNQEIMQLLSVEGNALYLPIVRQKVLFILTLVLAFLFQFPFCRFLTNRLKREKVLFFGALASLFLLYGSAREVLIFSHVGLFSIFGLVALTISGGVAFVEK